MNNIINKFLLAGDKFMPEMHLKQPGCLIVLVVHLQKTKKELNSLCKQGIQTLFIRMKSIRFAFSMIWPMVKQKL